MQSGHQCFLHLHGPCEGTSGAMCYFWGLYLCGVFQPYSWVRAELGTGLEKAVMCSKCGPGLNLSTSEQYERFKCKQKNDRCWINFAYTYASGSQLTYGIVLSPPPVFCVLDYVIIFVLLNWINSHTCGAAAVLLLDLHFALLSAMLHTWH